MLGETLLTTLVIPTSCHSPDHQRPPWPPVARCSHRKFYCSRSNLSWEPTGSPLRPNTLLTFNFPASAASSKALCLPLCCFIIFPLTRNSGPFQPNWIDCEPPQVAGIHLDTKETRNLMLCYEDGYGDHKLQSKNECSMCQFIEDSLSVNNFAVDWRKWNTPR